MGGPSDDVGFSIDVDPIGNAYTTGYFGGTADFDPGVGTYTLNSISIDNSFISKLDASGNFVWAKSIVGPSVSSNRGSSIVIDGVGNILTTGWFTGTTDFDPGASIFNLSTAGVAANNCYILKLTSLGNFVWAKQITGPISSFGEGSSINVDVSNNIYTTGLFGGTQDFDPGIGTYTLTTPGYDVFISKLDVSGNFIWAGQIGGTTAQLSVYSTVDASSNIYTIGSFTNTVDFDCGVGTYTMTSSGGTDIFIHKMSQSTVGIKENLIEKGFSIYPNPSLGLFNITLDSPTHITITNILGEEILSKQLASGIQTLDISNQTPGMYFVTINQEGKTSVTKLIKE